MLVWQTVDIVNIYSVYIDTLYQPDIEYCYYMDL